GQDTQKATYIAGISGTTVTGADVVISSTGQLGIATSSARYKRDIRDIGGGSAGLMRLRPVSFRYKNDPSGTLQYGLVAEEVARIYRSWWFRVRRQGPDGALLDAQRDAAQQAAEGGRRVAEIVRPGGAEKIATERGMAELE